jgi:hypothetical protein
MKILDKIIEVFNQYELKPIDIPKEYQNLYLYLDNNINKEKDYFPNPELTDGYLFDKYRKNIPHGWYGFSIGSPIIPAWGEILDKVLEICIANDPNFEIYQIKLKFGGIRFYVHSEIIEDINDVENYITDKLFDEKLIY